MSKILKNICFGLTPLIISSLVTPISSCVNMTSSQNQTKQDKQEKENVTFDDLCYIRQNALVNYSRLSKDKQKEIDNIVANNNDYKEFGNTFCKVLDYFYQDAIKDQTNNEIINGNYANITDLCKIANFNVVNYWNLEKTFNSSFYFDEEFTNNMRKILLYCKQNYLLQNEYNKKMDEFYLRMTSNNNFSRKCFIYYFDQT